MLKWPVQFGREGILDKNISSTGLEVSFKDLWPQRDVPIVVRLRFQVVRFICVSFVFQLFLWRSVFYLVWVGKRLLEFKKCFFTCTQWFVGGYPEHSLQIAYKYYRKNRQHGDWVQMQYQTMLGRTVNSFGGSLGSPMQSFPPPHPHTLLNYFLVYD